MEYHLKGMDNIMSFSLSPLKIYSSMAQVDKIKNSVFSLFTDSK